MHKQIRRSSTRNSEKAYRKRC